MVTLLILFILTLITLIGHGIWILVAKLVRTLQVPPSLDDEDPAPSPPFCARCGRLLLPGSGHCRNCGQLRDDPVAKELRDLEAAARQLTLFAKAGTLDAETCTRFQACIDSRRQLLRQPATPVIPQARPVPKPLPIPREAPSLPARSADTIIPQALPDVAGRPRDQVQPAPAMPRTLQRTDQERFAPGPPPRPPRRSLTEMLAAFMEERNIFWGELVGGLLMVGCSIALVLYLWQDLKNIPYFEFLIFVSLTAALFGAGLYALHRLKLETTSRGLLVIAMLLVPLNFVVMAGLAGQEEQTEPLRLLYRLGTEALSVGIFALLMRPAARVLVHEVHWPLILAVLGISISQLAVPRFLSRGQDSAGLLILLGCLPIGCFELAVVRVLFRWARPGSLTASQANGLFTFLGMAVFPLLVVLGFLVYWTENAGVSLHRLAPLLAMVGVPILAGGLLVHQRLASPTVAQGGTRTAGTGVALAGMAIMLGAVLLAWPQSIALTLVCLLNFAVLSVVGFTVLLPAAHAVALACFAVGYLTVYHFLLGHLTTPQDLGAHFLSASSGAALLLLVVLLELAGEALARVGFDAHGLAYAATGGVLAMLSLTLVNAIGLNQPRMTALVTGSYAVAGLLVNLRWQRAPLSYFSLALVLLATLWCLVAQATVITPLWSVVVAFEALTMALAAIWPPRLLRPPQAVRDLAATGAALALGLLVYSFNDSLLHPLSGCLLTATALLLAWSYQQSALVWLGSLLLLGSLLDALTRSMLVAYLPNPGSMIWWTQACLLHATLTLPASILLQRGHDSSGRRLFTEPLCQSALVGLSAALLLALFSGPARLATVGCLAWAAALWLILAWHTRRPAWFAVFQATLTATVLLGVSIGLRSQSWPDHPFMGLLDPWRLQAYAISLALLGFFWESCRLLLRFSTACQRLLEPPWLAVDRALLGLVVVGQLALAVCGTIPGILLELPDMSVGPPSWPPAPAICFGPGAWILLGCTTLALLVALWGSQQTAAVLGLTLMSLTVPVLVAGRFETELATASALRCGLAGTFLVSAVVLWLRFSIGRLAGNLGCPPVGTRWLTEAVRWCFLIGAAGAVLLLTTIFVAQPLSGWRPQGPSPDSLFGGWGFTVSYVTPLGLLVLGLVGYAVRERSAGYAFAAGQLATAAVPAAYALYIVEGHAKLLDETVFVRVLQLASMTSALWALGWLLSRPWIAAWRDRSDSPWPRLLMDTQWALGAACNGLLVLFGAGTLLVNSPETSRLTGAVGSPLGWLTLSLSLAFGLGHLGQLRLRSRGHLLAAFGLAVGVLAACAESARTSPTDWSAYHVLLGTWTGLGLIILAAEYLAPWTTAELADFSPLLPRLATWLRFSTSEYRGWLNGIGILVLGLAVRGTWEDPARPYWSAGATLAVSAMAGAVAWRARLPRYVAFSGLLINLAGFMVWIAWGTDSLASFGYGQVVCFALASSIWTGLELAGSRPASSGRRGTPSFPQIVAVLALVLFGALVVIGLVADLGGVRLADEDWLPGLAAVLTVTALGLRLWNPQARPTFGGLYAAGLSIIGLCLRLGEFTPALLGWHAALWLAAYALLASALSYAVPRLRPVWRGLAIPERAYGWPRDWFLTAQATVFLAVVALSVWILLTFPWIQERMCGPLAILLLASAGAILTAAPLDRWAVALRYATLALGVLLVAQAGWALLDLGSPALWLYRSILLMLALVLLTLVYGLVLPRLLPPFTLWAECCRRLGPVLGVLASCLLLVILIQEGLLFDSVTSRTPMALAAVLVVLLALVSMIAAAIQFAVVPGHDPLGLSDRGRRLYVYAAEGLFVLLFIHTRLTVPELFGGKLGKYWTLIVMAVAYVGVGLSEFFKRRKLLVLAEPLERTGVLLPLLPLLAFWVRPPEFLHRLATTGFPGLFPFLDYLYKLEPNYGRYALIWFLLGLLYALVAIARRSFWFGFLAALAANFGLWSLLYAQDLSLLQHPQLWLIPFAVIILVAGEINRDRLSEQQRAALRYVALLVIYISSTADMFLAGLGQSVVLPLVLALLSVGGALCGILLQVRTFLYLGVTFLFVVIFSMIWHAAVGQQHVWVWWASGVVLGAAIIALFAIFEKRRNDVLRVLDQVRKWDS
jgi:hypothetical protein